MTASKAGGARARRSRAARKVPAAVASGFGESALESLLGQTVALFHRLQVVAQEVHGDGEMSAGRRGVLRGLDQLGPQTVPQMARARPVSRQYIQILVNQLVGDGYAELIDNPAHKRSPLVHLTSKGTEAVAQMNRREAGLLADLPLETQEQSLRAAARVLGTVRIMFEGEAWKRSFKKKGPGKS